MAVLVGHLLRPRQVVRSRVEGSRDTQEVRDDGSAAGDDDVMAAGGAAPRWGQGRPTRPGLRTSIEKPRPVRKVDDARELAMDLDVRPMLAAWSRGRRREATMGAGE